MRSSRGGLGDATGLGPSLAREVNPWVVHVQTVAPEDVTAGM
jgi:hypothetical protein